MNVSTVRAARALALSVVFATPVFVTATGSAAAQDAAPNERQVRAWAASCAACHNTDGRSISGIPALAGRAADDTYRTLLEFKAGKRPATVMHQHARGYSDEELRRLADWFATIKPGR